MSGKTCPWTHLSHSSLTFAFSTPELLACSFTVLTSVPVTSVEPSEQWAISRQGADPLWRAAVPGQTSGWTYILQAVKRFMGAVSKPVLVAMAQISDKKRLNEEGFFCLT